MQGVMGRIRPKMSHRVPFLTLPKVPCALRKLVPKVSLPVYEGVIRGLRLKGFLIVGVMTSPILFVVLL